MSFLITQTGRESSRRSISGVGCVSGEELGNAHTGVQYQHPLYKNVVMAFVSKRGDALDRLKNEKMWR